MKIKVLVKPRSRVPGVAKVRERTFEVSVAALPNKGKANKAVVQQLARHFGVAPSLIEIVRGHASRHKIIEIPD